MRVLSRLTVVGAMAVVLAAGLAVFTVDRAVAADPPSAEGPTQENGGSIVEDFGYPGATTIEQARHIRLLKGDGHIMLVDCVADGDYVLVQSIVAGTSVGGDFCFQVTGTSGYVTMELSDSFLIRGDGGHNLTAFVGPDTATKPDEVPVVPNEWSPLVDPTTGNPQMLVELRVVS